MSFYKTVTIGRLEIGARLDLTFWRVGVAVSVAEFLRSAWVDIGPFAVWVEIV